MSAVADRSWIKDHLADQGYTQRDLSKAWGVSEPSVTRFLAGTESADPPFSRMVTLAAMLGMTLDDLARAMGLKGKVMPPAAVAQPVAGPRLGTISMTPAPSGLRVLLHLDVPAAVAGQIVALLEQAGAPSPAG